MNDWMRMEREAKRYKELYPPGTRLLLNNMNDPFAPVPSGTRGTVVHVDDIGTIHMRWDNGRSLGLVPGEDSFRKLTDKELEEEKLSLDDKLIDATNCSKEDNINRDDFSKEEPTHDI